MGQPDPSSPADSHITAAHFVSISGGRSIIYLFILNKASSKEWKWRRGRLRRKFPLWDQRGLKEADQCNSSHVCGLACAVANTSGVQTPGVSQRGFHLDCAARRCLPSEQLSWIYKKKRKGKKKTPQRAGRSDNSHCL